MTTATGHPGFCILPWISVQVNQDGSVLPCCRTDETYLYGHLKNEPLADAWNSPSTRDMRRKMLAGETLPQCRDCHSIEARGGTSSRQNFNRLFADSFSRVAETKVDGSIERRDLEYLGIRFSNTCNLKCRTCSATNSTAWTSDARRIDMFVPTPSKLTPTDSFDDLARQLKPHLASLKRIYFAGGEPLLHEDHYRFLEILIDAGRTDVTLEYNTNFTTLSFGEWNALELWGKFDHVFVGASLDGVGAHAELLRKGCRWNDIVANFHRLSFLSNVTFFIHCTVSVLNCFHLPDAIDEWIRRKMIRGSESFDVNLVVDPSYLAMKTLSENEREKLRSRYDAYLRSLEARVDRRFFEGVRSKLSQVIAAMEGEPLPADRSKLAQISSKLDALRSESLSSLVPELASTLTPETR